MYKIGVIGDRESVLGFKAVGLQGFPCSNSEEARTTLQQIAKDGFAIIYITEGFCKDIVDSINEYKDMRVPAIIPIPGMDGSYGVGLANLKKSVERAVGADILFGND